ncbi:hypothetical protein [Xanthomonas bonasiae]|uniref:hypothetical protein n=1 Tax=Xanthomonas bonasiae TaxID=2810351 RepID=UPI0017852DAD|nr:hypothetical protein [Xanthomonas surreyensis]MBD7923181.1 hypothetical protein [Xanthomonas surreyensis]
MKYIARPRDFKRPDMHIVGSIVDGHLVEGSAMPLPERIEIEPEPGSAHYFVFRYAKSGEFCGDTWHENLEAAFAQANLEYGLDAADFFLVHDGDSGSGHGGAA